jgi:hypothetical protein
VETETINLMLKNTPEYARTEQEGVRRLCYRPILQPEKDLQRDTENNKKIP